jgi:hypothetical protein
MIFSGISSCLSFIAPHPCFIRVNPRLFHFAFWPRMNADQTRMDLRIQFYSFSSKIDQKTHQYADGFEFNEPHPVDYIPWKLSARR